MKTMTNVEILKLICLLGDVRCRLFGHDFEHNDSRDDEINNLTPDEMMGQYCIWMFGTNSWPNLKNLYDQLQKYK